MFQKNTFRINVAFRETLTCRAVITCLGQCNIFLPSRHTGLKKEVCKNSQKRMIPVVTVIN